MPDWYDRHNAERQIEANLQKVRKEKVMVKQKTKVTFNYPELQALAVALKSSIAVLEAAAEEDEESELLYFMDSARFKVTQRINELTSV